MSTPDTTMIWFGSAAAAAIVSALASIATTAVNRHYQNRDRDKDNTHQLARLEKEHVQQLARLKQEHDQQLIRDQKADAQALRDKRSARLREIYPVSLNSFAEFNRQFALPPNWSIGMGSLNAKEFVATEQKKSAALQELLSQTWPILLLLNLESDTGAVIDSIQAINAVVGQWGEKMIATTDPSEHIAITQNTYADLDRIYRSMADIMRAHIVKIEQPI